MDAYLAIVSKREVRDYADRPIDPDTRRRILEAGRIAGSSANRQ
jgi:nitroreductase